MRYLTEREIASELLVIRDEQGRDPFVRYQEGRVSKGWLRKFIAHKIWLLAMARELHHDL